MSKEAMLYEKLEDNQVRCNLCAHRCKICEGSLGICQVRQNRGGRLYSLVYGKPVALNIDPIEKKPIFHLYPGSTSFSIATVGCNFRCGFCQNWNISQASVSEGRGQFVEPQQIVDSAKEHGCQSISYTYTEPTIFFEYACDIARLAHAEGMANIFVTNGYMTAGALKTIAPYLDGANVDLKSFREDFYRRICKAGLEPVLSSIRLMRELDIWVEVTTLVLPGQNDSKEELTQIAGFIADVGVEIPWHISRFHPDYKMTHLRSTPVDTLKLAIDIGKQAGLRYIYVGNVPGEESESTFCFDCGRLLIQRYGFAVLKNELSERRCPSCGATIDGIGM
ncbi:MAG: AmmeMemoRadiSam system radical SAM enzyme [bacterium]|nr:AmmeMemoRadiSam system radical SAM enzyme [bacterium]